MQYIFTIVSEIELFLWSKGMCVKYTGVLWVQNALDI